MLTFEYVKKFIEENEGYKLLSKQYIGCYHNLKIMCPNKHIFEMKWYKFQTGHRCPVCNGGIRLEFNYIKKQIENEGYILISTEYKNNKTNLEIQCPNGHNFFIRYADWVDGHRCRKCYENKIKYSIEEAKEIISNGGYELLSYCINGINDKIEIKCNKGHIYKGTLHNFLSFSRCPICSYRLHKSKGEQEMVAFIETIYNGLIIENDRTLIKNPITNRMLELDVYLPEINKAIEFNGEYWHNNYKDEIKINQCKEKNINFLVINYKEWFNNKTRSSCKEKIKNFIII
jgi:hypothetical protein